MGVMVGARLDGQAPARNVRQATDVLLPLLLWGIAWWTFSHAPVSSYYRLDHVAAIAYPVSDAGNDFMNGIALLSGEGWANWRADSRWSVYKPGWSAFLGLLAAICDRDTAVMQAVLTALYALSAPALYFVMVVLLPYRGARFVATVATVVFILSPQDTDWSFQRTMQTEGPTLLIALCACGLAVHFCGRGAWQWPHGLLLGLLMGVLCLVRTPAQYGVAGMTAAIALGVVTRPRARVGFVVALLIGVVCAVGPLYLRTSYHLRMLYTGTPLAALVGLEYTEVGRTVGGAELSPDIAANEGQAIRILRARAKAAVRHNLQTPWPMIAEGFEQYVVYTYSAISKFVNARLSDPVLFVPVISLTALGLVFAFIRVGIAALIPWAFSLGYMVPHVAFSIYRDRYGAAISWIGIVYALGGLIACVPSARRSAMRRFLAWRRHLRQGTRKRLTSTRWPAWWVYPMATLWLATSTLLLLWMDFRPAPALDLDAWLGRADVRSALSRMGRSEADVRQLVRDAVSGVNPDSPVRFGRALLPIVVRPEDPPLEFAWGRLEPRNVTYTHFFFVTPWKSGGFRFEPMSIAGEGLYAGFRHGDRVFVVKAAGADANELDAILPADRL